MVLRRRAFLRGTGALVAGAVLPFGVLATRTARASGFGELVPDPEGLLDLPPGFTYSVIDSAGDTMADGYSVPGRPDGMACFRGDDRHLILLRNHELSFPDALSAAKAVFDDYPAEAFNPSTHGAVTRVVVDAKTGRRVSSNLVLVGTDRNCAGGMSPWGWLSCEESTAEGHGYVFLCPPDAPKLSAPKRIVGYGRFRHEAAVVDPDTLVCYLTEDQPDSAFYRFVPHDRKKPFEGKLQAMKVRDADAFDTAKKMPKGKKLPIEWVDIDEPDPADGSVTVRAQARAKGAARIERGEGLALFGGGVYFCSTSGGPIGRGQVFRLSPSGPDSGDLELLAQSEDREVLDMPDNITVAPWGDVFMAEDGGGDDFIRVLTPEGEVKAFARNSGSRWELAGVTFSPDGRFLFFNMQGDQKTIAVTGPFPEVSDVGGYYGAQGGAWDPRLQEVVRTAQVSGGLGPAGAGAGVAGAVAVGAAALYLRARTARKKRS